MERIKKICQTVVVFGKALAVAAIGFLGVVLCVKYFKKDKSDTDQQVQELQDDIAKRNKHIDSFLSKRKRFARKKRI